MLQDAEVLRGNQWVERGKQQQTMLYKISTVHLGRLLTLCQNTQYQWDQSLGKSKHFHQTKYIKWKHSDFMKVLLYAHAHIRDSSPALWPKLCITLQKMPFSHQIISLTDHTAMHKNEEESIFT